MKKTTDSISIIPSEELSRLRLSGIIGRKGIVIEQVFGDNEILIGYTVLLNKSFQGEHLWFVPEDAVKDEEDSQ